MEDFLMTRAVRSRIAMFVVVGVLSSFITLTVQAPEASAIAPGEGGLRPSVWAPHHVFVQASNVAAWGNISYDLRWSSYELPSNLSVWLNTSDAARVFEVGYKSLDTAPGCRAAEPGAFFKAGFPDSMDVTVDYQEDPGDAVLWVSDMDVLANDQIANPNKLYSAWWDCDGANHFELGNRPFLEVSPNKLIGPEDPAFTFSLVHLNYVPSEQGDRSFPGMLAEQETWQTWIDSPWTHQSSVEDGELLWSNWWKSFSGQNITRFCDHPAGAAEGRCYLYLSAATPGDPDTYLQQTTYVRSWSKTANASVWSGFNVGINTGFQWQGYLRCPTFNTADCVVDVHIKVLADGWNTGRVQQVRYSVPRDGQWYLALSDSFGAPTILDNDVEVWVNTHGRGVDVDTLWVSSDL